MTNTVATEEQIEQVVLRTIAELDEQGVVILDGQPVTPDTVLFGADGLLDSVGLVSLVIAVEQALDDELGIQVALADERALSQTSSPFRSAASLAGYAAGEFARTDR